MAHKSTQIRIGKAFAIADTCLQLVDQHRLLLEKLLAANDVGLPPSRDLLNECRQVLAVCIPPEQRETIAKYRGRFETVSH